MYSKLKLSMKTSHYELIFSETNRSVKMDMPRIGDLYENLKNIVLIPFCTLIGIINFCFALSSAKNWSILLNYEFKIEFWIYAKRVMTCQTPNWREVSVAKKVFQTKFIRTKIFFLLLYCGLILNYNMQMSKGSVMTRKSKRRML